METQSKTLNEVFDTYGYYDHPMVIPYFQRRYVWGKEQWSRFVGDLFETEPDDGGTLFFGSLILKEQPVPDGMNPPFPGMHLLVDGQQRLTTFILALKALALQTEDDASFRERIMIRDSNDLEQACLQHNRRDRRAFERIVNLAKGGRLKRDGTQLTDAYNYLWTNIRERNTQSLTFTDLLQRAVFAVMELDPDEDEQRIFDTMNSLGKPLTTTDLLKNFFFEDGNVNAYEQMWKAEFELDEETRDYWNQSVSRRRVQTMIDIFFGAALQIMANRYTGPDGSTLSPEERKRMISRDRMITSYREFVDRYYSSAGPDLHGARRRALAEILEYAREFRAMFSPDVMRRPVYSDSSARLAALTLDLRLFSPIPYLLFIRRHVQNEATRREMFRLLESYLVRRVIANAGAAKYGELFSDLLRLGIDSPRAG